MVEDSKQRIRGIRARSVAMRALNYVEKVIRALNDAEKVIKAKGGPGGQGRR
jgi:hypothetical protein